MPPPGPPAVPIDEPLLEYADWPVCCGAMAAGGGAVLTIVST